MLRSDPVGASLQLVPNSLDYLSKDLRENINKSLHNGKFETVLQGNNLLSFNELKQQFNYLSVVYLKNGCLPCLPKFIEWHEKPVINDQ